MGLLVRFTTKEREKEDDNHNDTFVCMYVSFPCVVIMRAFFIHILFVRFVVWCKTTTFIAVLWEESGTGTTYVCSLLYLSLSWAAFRFLWIHVLSSTGVNGKLKLGCFADDGCGTDKGALYTYLSNTFTCRK